MFVRDVHYNPPMLFQAIDGLHVAADPAPYVRLGFLPSPSAHGAQAIHIGHTQIVFTPDDMQGLFSVGVRVLDLRATVEHLSAHGIPTDGPSLPLRDVAGTDLKLNEATAPQPAHNPAHSFPLKHLDHLAAITRDLDATCRFWADVLQVPVTGEVRTPHMIIRQLRIGDAIFELLGAAGPDSPLHQRAAGLVSMAAWEVDDLAAAVAQARAAGFTVPDPAIGVLPGTRTATIPAVELGGVAMQLLEYV